MLSAKAVAISLLTAGVIPFAANATGLFFTFAQWERLNPEARRGYIAGSFDGSSAPFDPLEMAIRSQIDGCLFRSKITVEQITEGVLAEAARHPNLRSGSVQAAITKFMAELCPDLLGKAAIAQIINLMDKVPPPKK